MLSKLISGALDCLNATLLALYAFLIIGPLGFLRGPLVLEKTLWYLRVFIPTGMMSKAVRIGIDWRLGHFDVAIAQAEEAIAQIEVFYQQAPACLVRRRVLADLYTILSRSYMHAGHMDEAMAVILRAKKFLGVDRLPGLVDLDAKTAHLVRAGLAAGRLLEGGGLATMFVKTEIKAPPSTQTSQGSAGGSAKAAADAQAAKDKRGAKVIQFPRGHTV